MARSAKREDAAAAATPPTTDAIPPTYNSDQEKTAGDTSGHDDLAAEDGLRASFSVSKDGHVHRQLKSRHIQLIGIGGTIGTVLFVRNLTHLFFPFSLTMSIPL